MLVSFRLRLIFFLFKKATLHCGLLPPVSFSLTIYLWFSLTLWHLFLFLLIHCLSNPDLEMLQNRQHTGEYDWAIGRKGLGILEKLIKEKQEKQRNKNPELKNSGANSYWKLLQRFPWGDLRFLPIVSGNTISRNSYWCSEEQMTKREEEKRIRIH